MQVGFGHLGLTPDAFWNLTFPELNAKLEGFAEFHGVKRQESAAELREDLEDMLEVFPDGPIDSRTHRRHKRRKLERVLH